MVRLPFLARDGNKSAKSATFSDNCGPLDPERKVSDARARLRTSRSRAVDHRFQEYMDCYHQDQLYEMDEAGSHRHPNNGSQTERPSTNYFERDTWFAAKAVLAAQHADQRDEQGRRFFIDKFTGRPMFKAAEMRRKRVGIYMGNKSTNMNTVPVKTLDNRMDSGRHELLGDLSQEESLVNLKQELRAERRLVEQRLDVMQKACSRYETGKKQAFHSAKEQASVERAQATEKMKLDLAAFHELQAQVQKRLNAIVIVPPSLPPIMSALSPLHRRAGA